MSLQYLPIPKDYADKIRHTLKDDFGHAAEISIAGESGYGPCRCCLKQFEPGEKRILFSYAPLAALHPYSEVGPVYIHENCKNYQDHTKFPDELINGRVQLHFVLRSYNREQRMIAAMFVRNSIDLEKTIEELFIDENVFSVHIRNATYQCFIAEVRKTQGTGS